MNFDEWSKKVWAKGGVLKERVQRDSAAIRHLLTVCTSHEDIDALLQVMRKDMAEVLREAIKGQE